MRAWKSTSQNIPFTKKKSNTNFPKNIQNEEGNKVKSFQTQIDCIKISILVVGTWFKRSSHNK